MDIESVGIIVASLGVIVSVLALTLQIRVQIRQMKSSTSVLLSSRMDAINLLQLEHPEIFDELEKPYLPLPGVRQSVAELVTDLKFTLFEEIYMQYTKFRLIDREDWLLWKESIKENLWFPFITGGYWEESKKYYAPQFVAEIEQIIHEHQLEGRRRHVSVINPNNHAQFRIRLMTELDIQSVYDLGVLCFRVDMPPYLGWTIDGVKAHLQEDSDHCFVAVDDSNRVIGFSLGSASFDSNPTIGFIEWTAISAEKRGQGLGLALFSKNYESLRDKGVKSVVTDIEIANRASQKMVESIDFELAATVGYWLKNCTTE